MEHCWLLILFGLAGLCKLGLWVADKISSDSTQGVDNDLSAQFEPGRLEGGQDK